MPLIVQRAKAAIMAVAGTWLFIFFGCTSVDSTLHINTSQTENTPLYKLSIPTGWSEINLNHANNSILFMLVNKDFSASMVLKEYHVDDLTRKLLLSEGLPFIANISLRLKMADETSQRRITRVPEKLNNNTNAYTYVYEERGLLRRVILFERENKLCELELMQERSTRPFDKLTEDQIALLKEIQSFWF